MEMFENDGRYDDGQVFGIMDGACMEIIHLMNDSYMRFKYDEQCQSVLKILSQTK